MGALSENNFYFVAVPFSRQTLLMMITAISAENDILYHIIIIIDTKLTKLTKQTLTKYKNISAIIILESVRLHTTQKNCVGEHDG